MKGYIIILFALSLITSIASAEEVNCLTFESEINAEKQELGSCWDDKDCEIKYFGCPFDSGCIPSIISTSEADENKALEEKIATFLKNCPDRRKYCEEKPATSCKPNLKLLCLSGKCVTQTHVIFPKIIKEPETKVIQKDIE